MLTWPFIDICQYCQPQVFTISDTWNFNPVVRNRICDRHVQLLAQQNEQWSDRHRFELWLELL